MPAAVLIALLARRARLLTRGGAIAAALVGAAAISSGGWSFTAVLFAFFLPSVALSRIGIARKRALVDIGKPGARDGLQVLANGGVASLCALAALRFGPGAFGAAFAGAFAAAAADTWGTEIGTVFGGSPRSILTLARIPTGLSGGVTIAGTLAEIAGALAVGLVADVGGVAAWLPVAIGGVAGALVDSLLGATLQALRYCPRCRRACETDPHACGTPAQLVRGAEWMTNDAVNCAATLAGAIAAATAYALLPPAVRLF